VKEKFLVKRMMVGEYWQLMMELTALHVLREGIFLVIAMLAGIDIIFIFKMGQSNRKS